MKMENRNNSKFHNLIKSEEKIYKENRQKILQINTKKIMRDITRTKNIMRNIKYIMKNMIINIMKKIKEIRLDKDLEDIDQNMNSLFINNV